MPTPAPALTAIPDFPALADRTTYNAKAFAWATALKTATGPELAALGTNVYNNAVEAATAASTATNKASEASTSAGTATTKASQASTSAATAAQKLIDIEALYDQFDDRYLGSKSDDPTLDNDGNALVNGAFYISSATGFLRAYTTAGGWVQGISAVSGVTSVNGATGAISGIATTAGVTAERSATATLTNKTITETVFAITGTAPALAATDGAVQTWTLTAASAPTSSLTSGQSIILQITPGAFALTWPANTVFTKVGGSGAAPALFSAGKTTVVLWRVGSVLYVSHLGDTV